MSEKKREFTKEEKAKIALEAVSGGENELKKLSSKHGITEKQILNWAEELGISSKTPDESKKPFTAIEAEKNQIDIDVSTEEFSDSMKFGASFDNLNIKRLTFWTVFGTFLVLIMIIGLLKVYDFTITTTQKNVAAESIFYDISELKERDNETLNSFGVVDPEEGIYRIPIDSAISLMVKEIE
ncbi:MAG: transposase [Balneolaceae bacterium]